MFEDLKNISKKIQELQKKADELYKGRTFVIDPLNEEEVRERHENTFKPWTVTSIYFHTDTEEFSFYREGLGQPLLLTGDEHYTRVKEIIKKK